MIPPLIQESTPEYRIYVETLKEKFVTLKISAPMGFFGVKISFLKERTKFESKSSGILGIRKLQENDSLSDSSSPGSDFAVHGYLPGL